MADLSVTISDDIATTEQVGPVTGWDASVEDDSVTSEFVGYYADAVSVQETLFIVASFYLSITVSDLVFNDDSPLFVGPVPNPLVEEDVVVEDVLSTYPDLVFVKDFPEATVLNPFETIQTENVGVSEFLGIEVLRPGTNAQLIIKAVPDTLKIEIERL